MVWAPFSMMICGVVAYKRGLDVSETAWSGFGASLLFWLPGIYFLSRLLGIPITRKVVVAAYVLVFAAWILGPIPGGISFAWGELHFADQLVQDFVKSQGKWEWRVFLLVAPPIVGCISWALSLWVVLRRPTRGGAQEYQSAERAMPSKKYLMPFVLLAAYYGVTFLFWLMLWDLSGGGI